MLWVIWLNKYDQKHGCPPRFIYQQRESPRLCRGDLRAEVQAEDALREVEVFRKLAEQKESRILEGHLMADHVHMLNAIPPKYAVSQVIGSIKGKSAMHLARVNGERKRNFVGKHFGARGFFVLSGGRDEEVVREYIRHQEKEDERLEQLSLFQ